MRRIRATKAVKALAHITGGGFPDNIPRVLPQGLGVTLDLHASAGAADLPLACRCGGRSPRREMLRTFNCGVGMVAVVAAGREPMRSATRWSVEGETVVPIREVVAIARDTRAGRLSRTPRSRLVTHGQKRVAVLISGRGSNMVALIEAAKASLISG